MFKYSDKRITFPQTLHRCCSSFQPLSETLGFLDEAQSALIGQHSTHSVIGQPLPAHVGNVG